MPCIDHAAPRPAASLPGQGPPCRGVPHGPPRSDPLSPYPRTAIYILNMLSYPICPMARRVKVQQLPNDQYVVTIPKALAEAMGLRKGETVQWSIEQGGLLLKRLK
jgi:hypothetical protein